MAGWSAWNDSTTTTTSATATDVWYLWVDTGTAATTTTLVWQTWAIAYTAVEPRQEPTEAEIQAKREREKKLKEAQERARELLLAHLSEKQKQQLLEENGFDVEAQSGKRYHIARGRAGNVYSLDEKRRKINKHCIHPADFCPDEDTMLAQMLWLRWNEEEFLTIANITKVAA